VTAICHRCGKPVEAADFTEEENPDDPFEPFIYHTWCHPEFVEKFPDQEEP
jgi:hypothetical protein